MPAERAGYSVTIFLIDVSPSMGKTRDIDLPPGPDGKHLSTEMTNLEWSLQFVKLKIQEMIFNGRKTEQCGVILFGTEDTENIINTKDGGYDYVSEYIPIGQPHAGTIAKLNSLEPSDVIGDPVDALIVGIETQDVYLHNKSTWTRKIVLLTDGENPIEIQDWEATVKKMNALDVSLTVIGVDFDDDEFDFHEEDKSVIKTKNEQFFRELTSSLKFGIMGTCAYALQEVIRPEIKQVKSALVGTVLRIGDVDLRPDEAAEIMVKTSKCTAVARPKGWKKFARRVSEDDGDKTVYTELKMRTEYYVDRSEHDEDAPTEDGASEDGDVRMEEPKGEKVEKEQLVRGFKYGQTYVPCPDGQFSRLNTKKGIDICGFFYAKNFRRDYSMGEVHYVWADPSSPQQQVALSSIVQAMFEKDVMAIARWVTKDGMDPRMGALTPSMFEHIDCLLWVQMPFADDLRRYSFPSLDNLISKNGTPIKKHPYLPTDEQLEAMGKFVDAMDLMDAGDKDDAGNRTPWFDTRLSYNPALHRTKQALFHSAIVDDVTTNPIPPPHPELLKYFEPPRRVVKRAREAVEECKALFNVREVPKRAPRKRKDGHVRARDDNEDMLLLDLKGPKRARQEISAKATPSPRKASTSKALADSDTETEDEDDSDLLTTKSEPKGELLPTPARSQSPANDPGRAPGRIIGTAYPLQDFKKNIAQGDIVTKAVEDLSAVIIEIAMMPFSSRRTDELLECMKTLRDTSLKEDEIDAWNQFIQDLKRTCSAEPGNPDFWTKVKELGRSISLISGSEAAELGGISNISESAAEEFIK